MPEGPEIRREADAIAGVLVGQPLTDVFFEPARLKRGGKLLVGCRVLGIDTHGKALLTRFDNGLTLYSHNQLYGRWYVRKPGEAPRTNRTLRVGLHTSLGSALLYSATEVHLLDEAGLAAHPFLRKLGPDVLDPALGWRDVASRLLSPAFAGRALGGLYLDQGFIAGIGNYLRSEMLFFAGLRHEHRPRDLPRRDVNRLARATLEVARRAYAARGVTVEAGLAQALKSRGLRYSEFRFAVFDRAGDPCRACGDVVRRVTVTTRRLYFCPSCQR